MRFAAMRNRPSTYPKVNNIDLVSAYPAGRNSIQLELYAMLEAVRKRLSTYPKAVNNLDLVSVYPDAIQRHEICSSEKQTQHLPENSQ